MVSLVRLVFSECPELKSLLHGIEYLKALEELRLEGVAEELLHKHWQETEELMKISHIRNVTVVLTQKNIPGNNSLKKNA